MLLLTALVLLYVSQLVYVSNRWWLLTRSMIEAAQISRMRRSVDWTAASSKLPQKPASRLRNILGR